MSYYYLIGKPSEGMLASSPYYHSYVAARQRCDRENRRPGAPEREPWEVCVLVAAAPPPTNTEGMK